MVAVAKDQSATGVQVEERPLDPVAYPGAITRIDQQVLALSRRLDDVLEVLLPDPERELCITLTDLERENKELKISLYVMAGLFFLLFLGMRR